MGLDLGVMSAAVTLNDKDYRRKLSGLEGASNDTFKKIAEMAQKYLTFYAMYSGIKKCTEAFYAQQDAIEGVRASLRNLGAEANYATTQLSKTASEIQKTTKFGDETVLAAMSQGMRLGIKPDDIENVTRSAVGLTAKIGVDLPTAMSLLARASAGHTEMLARYGIQLDTTLTKEEQFQQVLKAGADSFELAEAAAITAGGQMAQFKNNIGDTAEAIGESLNGPLGTCVALLNNLSVAFNNSAKQTRDLIIGTAGLAVGIRAVAKATAAASLQMRVFAGLTTGVLGLGLMAINAWANRVNASLASARQAGEEYTAGVMKELNARAKARDEEAKYLNRLEQLSHYERLNNQERQEAQRMIGELSDRYGNLNASIDANTGKLTLNANALRARIKAQQTLEKEQDARRKLSTLSQEKKDLAQITGLDDERAIRLALQSERGKAQKGVLADGAAGREERIKNLERQLELIQKSRDAARELAKAEEDGKNAALAGEAEVKAAREKAREEYRAAVYSREFQSADAARQSEMMKSEIERLMRNSHFSTLDAFREAGAAGNLNEDEAKTLQTILDLDAKRKKLREDSADAFQRELMDYDEYIARQKEEIQNRERDRAIQNLERSGNHAGARKIIAFELEEATKAAQQLQGEYESAIREAQADNLMTEAERKRIAELRSKMQEAMSDQNRWSERLSSHDDSMRQKNTQKTVGAWSAEMLTALLGAKQSPEAETAKNTKEMVRLIREQNSVNAALTYGG